MKQGIRQLSDIQIDFLKSVSEDSIAWQNAISLLSSPPEVDVGQTPADVIFKDDIMELLHYRPLKDESRNDRPPVLMVYALINQPYILDIEPGRSVVESLLKDDIDVYLINWGNPDDRHQFLSLEDYVDYFIDVCVDKVRKASGRDSVHILGYCMGGTMSAMYAALYPEKVKSLILMAAGLDFENDTGTLGFWADKEYFDPEKVARAFGNCPADFLDGAYQWLDPVGNMFSKFKNFSFKIDDKDFVEMFLRMERWIHDGKPLPGPTFSKFVRDLYQENLLIKNEFYLGGRSVDIRKIDMPLLNIVGDYDTLVPPESSLPFNEKVGSTDTTVMSAPVGHIGLSVSSKTHQGLWRDVARWIHERDGPVRTPLTSIKGVGEKYAEKLQKAGIDSAEELIDADVEQLSKKTGIPDSVISKWIVVSKE